MALIALPVWAGTLFFSPSAHADSQLPPSPGSRLALIFTVLVSDETSGKPPVLRNVAYTMTGDALRIDAPADGTGKSYIWNLETKTVASLDNEKRTYHSDSLDKIMGFVDFSQLLGQYAGNNPKDSVTLSNNPSSIAGITCRTTTRLHHFKGRVVGMINGDQTTTQCLADSFPGSDLYGSFQNALAALSKSSSGKGTGPRFSPLSLETVRTTDYTPGFLVKILATLHLYDISRVPGRQTEKETVSTLFTRPVPDSIFSIPSSYKKEAAPAKP
jgi:hypothetical protein